MYDFESVSVSSFEAASLAATLTEKSADGWDVVAIVTAGSDVVAYLRRADDSAVAESADAAASTADDHRRRCRRIDERICGGRRAADADVGQLRTVGLDRRLDDVARRRSRLRRTPAGAPAATTTAAAAAGAGWGGTTESSSWGGSAQQTTTPTTPSVPAGWYADPAGRFELRYWDGTAWTEHVSRGGQQYTDPPVA